MSERLHWSMWELATCYKSYTKFTYDIFSRLYFPYIHWTGISIWWWIKSKIMWCDMIYIQSWYSLQKKLQERRKNNNYRKTKTETKDMRQLMLCIWDGLDFLCVNTCGNWLWVQMTALKSYDICAALPKRFE